MGQEWLVYSFVARGTVILAEFTELTGNFPAVATTCLEKLPTANNNKFTYKYDRHNYEFIIFDGYAYCVVAKETVGKQISDAFLERVREDFKKRYGRAKADTAAPKSLSEEFGPVMKGQMQYVIDHVEEIDKLMKVKAQVSQVKSLMEDTITKTLERGVNLTVLCDKTQDLHNSAQEFKKKGDQIRRKMWYKNMKTRLIVLGILLVLALVIWLSICHGFNCAK